MQPPPINTVCRMFCRQCGYALIGLPSHRCPECGSDFDPDDPKSFRTHPPRSVFHRLFQIGLVLVGLTLILAAYAGYLDWRVHVEKKAIKFLTDNGAGVTTYDTTPRWAKAVLRGHGAWLWERAKAVALDCHRLDITMPPLLAAVDDLKSLKVLHLDCSQLTDGELAQLEGLPELQELDLYETQVDDAGLGLLKRFPSLQKLNLGEASVTNAGLAHLECLRKLQDLDLSQTLVDDAGLSQLKRLTTLQTLILDGTSVTEAGLAQFKGMPNLRTLSLRTMRKVYDIRALLASEIAEFEDHPAPLPGQGVDDDDKPVVQADKITRAERVDDLIKLIEEVICPDTWGPQDDPVRSIRENNGDLLIIATATEHEKTKKFLAFLEAEIALRVHVRAVWIVAWRAEVEKNLKPVRDAPLRDKATAILEIDPQVLQKLSGPQFGGDFGATAVAAPRRRHIQRRS